MATIIPFKGIRPTRDKVHLVASRAVDSYEAPDLTDKLLSNPFTFLHIINPDFSDHKKTQPGSPERLKKIKAKYEQFISEGVFEKDNKPCYYIYRQVKGVHEYTGIIACTAIDDYFSGIIKIHEQTLTEREEKLMHYLEVCDFNAEPVLFSYKDDAIINKVTAEAVEKSPVYDFSTTDKVHHQLWILDDAGKIELIRKQFEKMNAIYIADGHHRSASSALLGKLRREKNKTFTGKEAYNYYLGVFFPENQLTIYDFNRTVSDLGNLSTADLVKKIAINFDVKDMGHDIYKASGLHNFSMYLEGKWFSLTPKKEIINYNNPVECLDAAILTKYILSPVLHIHDLKTDKRISFVPGIKGMEELKNKVDSGKAKVAFGLFPVTMQQIKNIADTNNIMPPKTTFVEPKMRSGLVIYSLADGG